MKGSYGTKTGIAMNNTTKSVKQLSKVRNRYLDQGEYYEFWTIGRRIETFVPAPDLLAMRNP